VKRYFNCTALFTASLLTLVACTSYQTTEDRHGGVATLPADAQEASPPSLVRPDRTKAVRDTPTAPLPAQPSLTVEAAAGWQQAPRAVPMKAPALERHRGRVVPDRENYAHFDDNPLQRVLDDPVSTFSIDVDTGAYANVRRFLNQGRLPPHDAVRVEELINYFTYRYPAPEEAARPFSITTEIGPTPWNDATQLLHIGIQGYRLAEQELPPANLVFLVDVSGSMRAANKLELLKPALKMLARRTRAEDSIAIVVYAGASGVVLPPTRGDERAKINAAIDNLSAGGSTNGAAGIRLAYQLAEQNFDGYGINRVILATDGDFNVGTSDIQQLKELVAAKRLSGVALTTLGFGSGNYNDSLIEQIADAGDGNYAYIDNLNEARKVLSEELSATLMTIARDVKVQIEFNPETVSEYRLIGYVNRRLRDEDFANDKVDAGDIGAGHSVTALYEIALHGRDGERLPKLRYSPVAAAPAFAKRPELGIVRLRYKSPRGSTSRLLERAVHVDEVRGTLPQTSEQYRFSAAVAAFGESLRGGRYLGEFDLQGVQLLARESRGEDIFGYRAEFLQLVGLALALRDGVAQISR
jgi:Ca-activated chloride channel family protein